MSHFNISLFSTKHTSAVMDTFFFKCMWVVCLFVFTVKKKTATEEGATEEGGEVAR